MPDLSFRIGEITALPYAAVPTICVPIHVTAADPAEQIRAVSLNCQVQIEPLRRDYSPTEEARLLELFGERERWARTMKPMLWINTVVKVPGFTGHTVAEMQLPCTMDFDVACTKYFYGLQTGSVGVSVLFSGSIFYVCTDGSMQVAPIPWDREAHFDLPVEIWQDAIHAHYPDCAWLRLPKETFDRLYHFKATRGLPSWEAAIDRLLNQSGVPASSGSAAVSDDPPAHLEPASLEGSAFEAVEPIQ